MTEVVGLGADSPSIGLSEQQAQRILALEGFNDLPAADRRGLGRIVADALREPMFALLLGAELLYLLLGDLAEAAMLLVFATLSVSISVIQEARSERVLDALRDIASPRALVIRDGERRRIPGREVVRGDAIVLLEGDRVTPGYGSLPVSIFQGFLKALVAPIPAFAAFVATSANWRQALALTWCAG